MSSHIEISFSTGKMMTLDTESESIADFFETYSDDGDLPGWLLFPDGYAVNAGNIDWMRVEANK